MYKRLGCLASTWQGADTSKSLREAAILECSGFCQRRAPPLVFLFGYAFLSVILLAVQAAYGAKSENTDTLQCILKHMVDPQTGTQPQVVRALMQATYSAGLDGVEMTALGRSIAYGMTALVELLIGFCRCASLMLPMPHHLLP